jgi:hypothetical protein
VDVRIKLALRTALSRDLVLDLYDLLLARASAAHDMIRDHADLDDRRSRMVVGRVRFPMQERSFEESCQRHGGLKLDTDVLPGTDLKFFQPFFRFPTPSVGVILGFASMPEGKKLPNENISRKSGVTLNYHLENRFDFDGTGPKPGDIYALFLVARDPAHAGRVTEVAIGVIDAEYDDFIFYETVEEFLRDIGDSSGTGDEPPPPYSRGDVIDPSLVKLKPSAKPFVAPEEFPANGEDEAVNSPA